MTWRKTNNDQQLKQILAVVLDTQTRVKALQQKVDAIMSDQSHLDADVARLVADNAAQKEQLDTIATAVDAIKAANPGVDLSALETALGGTDANVAEGAADVTAVEGLETPPPPPPA